MALLSEFRAFIASASLDWLDAYHLRVATILSPLVDDTTRPWLAAATRPLAQG